MAVLASEKYGRALAEVKQLRAELADVKALLTAKE